MIAPNSRESRTAHAVSGEFGYLAKPTRIPSNLRQDPPHLPVLDRALVDAVHCLLSMQKPDGHWCAELQGDTILESEYILLMAILGRDQQERVRKAARYILTQMGDHGAWSNYPGGPVEVSVSVKAYFALKIAGHCADAVHMRRARQAILKHGGAKRCNSFTKFYLAALGQFPYSSCATVPPEMMFLPTSAYFNLYAMSAWTRTIVVPLSIFSAYKPVRKLPDDMGIAELFLESPFKRRLPHAPTKRWFTPDNAFLAIDLLLKLWEKWGPIKVRAEAVRRASAWMRAHFADSDGVGAIFPPIIYTIISLHCLGYARDSKEMLYALKQLDDLMIEEGDMLRVQPCHSPVWDTALALNTLAIVGRVSRPVRDGPGEPSYKRTLSCRRAARWLLDREVRRPGDWSLRNSHLEPAGWFFEYRNGFYPDTDDTAMVLMGLARSGCAWVEASAKRERIPAVDRGLRWLLGMQNKDGGWAAFDRDINRELLTKVPFADHNAMLDPSCPDITARALEALGQFGYRPGHPQVERALAFIEEKQDRRGCWIGRWGVNYLYGTWQVLAGLDAIGVAKEHRMIRKAARWLKDVQQASGGWGESCHSYEDPSTAGQGPVTASQTGWALLGLMHAGEAHSDAVGRGIEYLLETQGPDGNWEEDQFTGTGFPKVFYLKYHNYRLYFPLMALARYRAALPFTFRAHSVRPERETQATQHYELIS
ncbi:MAG: squalene--hopene cyclase [Gemmataceae bacterium]|nr:squalene--hopene cyclase [Gemmataceae bacterium]MCI0743078.1 squalene--hopene cyclase [Gemmataceae bacterium]